MPPPEASTNQNAAAFSKRTDATGSSGLRVLTLLLLFAAGTILRFLFLTRKPFWFDESFSVEIARLNWSNFLHLLWWREANMSLYYLLLRGWLRLSLHQGSEFFVRSLSVILSAAALPAIYWLARLLFNRRVGLISAALLAFNAYHIRYAQEARSYALFFLLATLSSAFLVADLRGENRRRNRLGYLLTSILAVYAHFYALLLIAAQWLALRLLGNGPSTANVQNQKGAAEFSIPPRMNRVWFCIAVFMLPLLSFVGKMGAGPIRWIQRPGLQDLLEFFEHLSGNGLWIFLLYAIACIAAAVPFGKELFVLRKNAADAADSKAWPYQFLLIWLFFPLILTVLLSFARPVFLARYLIFCLPALIILAAAGLARLRSTWLLAPALAAMLLLSLHGTLSYYDHDFDLNRDASSAASNFILDHSQPGDAVMFHIAGARFSYEFFRSLRGEPVYANAAMAEAQTGPEIVFPRHADQLDYRDFMDKPTDELIRSLPAHYDRVWLLLMDNESPTGPDPTTVKLIQALGASWPHKQQWNFPQVEVRLYSRK